MWVKLPETGTVVSYVVVNHETTAFAEEVPYAVANVLIDGTDGKVRLLSNVVGLPVVDVKVGLPVRVFFEDVTDEITLPKFRPA